MFYKTECVAMLLAGGQGSRLGVLTKKVAKPAVPYGGKYRIIDFAMSNCVNSGIDTVGVLTQYQPLELNDYIGSGVPWDLDRTNGGVHILPPYQRNKGADWYKGTANAVYQNMNFIERYDPEYVLVLSGDHVYKMDYSEMIDFHKKTNADCTIAVLDVSLEEASRFGIMNTDADGRIYEFEEKPAKPKSTKASMGVYVFTWKKLREYLIRDEADESSSNDFGKNVIPGMLADGQRLMAFPFEGYWKDVGTIDSLWDANLDLLNPGSNLDLNDRKWKIYSRNSVMPPAFIGKEADVQNSVISEGCEIEGFIDYSVLFPGVTVEEGAEVHYSIIMPGAVIKKGAAVKYAIIGENSTVEQNAAVGAAPEQTKQGEWGVAVVGPDVTVKEGTAVAPKEMIDGTASEVKENA